MYNEYKVLIAEDDPEIVEILRAYLHREGFVTIIASNGGMAVESYQKEKPNLVILDIRMPVLDGWQVLTELRRQGDVSVIMLTANDDDVDKLSALRIGADDYIVKPFNPAEVVARVQAVLRRTRPIQVQSDPELIYNDWLDINLTNHRVIIRRSGRNIAPRLTLTEFKILVHMARYPERVFTRIELVETCLPEGETLPRTVDSHISKLRKKLEEEGVYELLQNVRGFGYRLGK